MRPVQLADIESAARVLLLLEPGLRQAFIAQLCRNANLADRFRKRTGRRHPQHGTGSLMSAAMQHPVAARPAACRARYLDCLHLVISHLRDIGGDHSFVLGEGPQIGLHQSCKMKDDSHGTTKNRTHRT